MNKPLKDILLSIKNSSTVKLNEFYCNYSKKNLKLLECLYAQGFVQSFIIQPKLNNIKIFLRYVDNKPIFTSLKLLSTTFNSKITPFKELSHLNNKRFVLFLNTNIGFVSVYDCRKTNIGGKLLFLC